MKNDFIYFDNRKDARIRVLGDFGVRIDWNIYILESRLNLPGRLKNLTLTLRVVPLQLSNFFLIRENRDI